MKRLTLLLILLINLYYNGMAQSVIEVIDPAEADIILLQVDKKEDADIVVYKTKKSSESKQWDCMWMFKKWGFSDLSIFIYTDVKDTSKFVDEDLKYKFSGRVYYTQNKDERGYKDPDFQIEGLIRKAGIADTTGFMANANNDTIQKTNNDTIQNINTDSLKVEINPPVDTTTVRVLTPAENIVFKVQVGACHRQIPEAELHKRYPGNKEITMEMHEGWYKYLIGNFNRYSEAKQEKLTSGTPDAWVVVYKDNKRVPITTVVNLLSYYPLSKLLILMLS